MRLLVIWFNKFLMVFQLSKFFFTIFPITKIHGFECNKFKYRLNIKNFTKKIVSFYSELPIHPPPTNDQLPAPWWSPKCCDKSLLVGTYKLGCENYLPMRNDPALCFFTHLGPEAATLTVA